MATAAKDDGRKSSYAMRSVDEAMLIVLEKASLIQHQVMVDLKDASGHIVAQDLHASDPFPAFPASIMDGYAVIGPIEPGIYEVIDRVHAGDIPRDLHQPSLVSYITTGSMLPTGANAVVKIEDTELIEASGSVEKRIRINVSVKVGENVRQIGSDINVDEIILKKGDRIGPAELGLLATIGLSKIPCYKKPVIGVMSTGSELIDASDAPIGSQIRDSNRPTLIAAFIEDGYDCIDLGIIQDQEHDLRDALLDAAHRCDVVVTSGGVSMGAKDYVKPLLGELGKIHFGRLNMKPGKPTTFASLKSGPKEVLFFGLPGNPVSCLVTKSLLIDPGLKRIQGLDSLQWMHPQIVVKLIGSDFSMDAERPEYHRVIVSYDNKQGSLVAQSTGNQRSSRLLSMKSANALICIAQGNGKVAAGSEVIAPLLRPLPPPTISSQPFHHLAASADFSSSISTVTSSVPANVTPSYESFDNLLNAKATSDWKDVSVAVLTISDRAYQGVYADESGPEIVKMLALMSTDDAWPLKITIVAKDLVPDDISMIQNKISAWSAQGSGIDAILTTGGTGFGPRDLTPEAIKPLLHRDAPGVAQALINEGLKHTPLAVMSRPVVGTINQTLVCTLPGSVKAVRENIAALKVLLPRMMEMIKSGKCEMRK